MIFKKSIPISLLKIIYLFIWLQWVLVAAHWDLSVQSTDSLVVEHGLQNVGSGGSGLSGCSKVCGISVAPSGMCPMHYKADSLSPDYRKLAESFHHIKKTTFQEIWIPTTV